MSVDVLLFTGMAAYANTVKDFGNDPVYETRSRTSGTYRIATYIRTEFDLDVEVIDFIFSWTLDELKEICRSRIGPDTRMVGIGGIFFLSAPVCIQLFEWVKQQYPHVTTIAGSQDIWSISQIPNIDYYVTGYGELGVKAVLEGNPIYRDFQMFPHMPKVKNVDCWRTKEYNAYPWPILTINYEKRDFIIPEEVLSFETSRGCRFKCSYCNFPILGVKDDYTRDADDFDTNLRRNYDEWGVTEYIITDDTFNDYVEKIRKYADRVEQMPFTPNFTGYVRADLLTMRKGDLEEMARMRFNSHLYGIESTNYESAKAIGKGGKPEKILPGILEAKEYFLKHNGFYRAEMSFIWGLPHETRETLDFTFKWLDENWVGEAVSMFPLHIMRDNGFTRPNDMSNNMDKYGYKTMQPVEVTPVGNRLDHIFENPNIHPYFKDRIRKQIPDPNSPQFQMGSYLWKNENFDYIESFIGVQENLFGHERFWDRAVPTFNQANWQAVGYKKEDMMKTFRELGEMMNPPQELVKQSIEDYKQKKLSL